MSKIEVKPDFQTLQSSVWFSTSQTASSANGFTRQMCAVPGVAREADQLADVRPAIRADRDRGRDRLGGHLRRQAGNDVRHDLVDPARHRHGVALGGDPEQVVARGVGDEDVEAERREPVRVRLARVRREVDVGRVDVDRLVGEDVEDGLGRFARGGLAVENPIHPDAPARAIRGPRDVGESDRISGRASRAHRPASSQPFEDRARRSGPTLADEDRLRARDDALRRAQFFKKHVQMPLGSDGPGCSQAQHDQASGKHAGRATWGHGLSSIGPRKEVQCRDAGASGQPSRARKAVRYRTALHPIAPRATRRRACPTWLDGGRRRRRTCRARAPARDTSALRDRRRGRPRSAGP